MSWEGGAVAHSGEDLGKGGAREGERVEKEEEPSCAWGVSGGTGSQRRGRI